MKRNTTLLKLLLVFVPFVMTSNSFSQIDSTYVPFPMDSVAWNETDYDVGPGDLTFISKYFYLIGDTVMDTLTYSKLYESYYLFSLNTSGTPFRGGIREENKKIYFKKYGQEEVLYYDFNLNIGDSFLFEFSGMEELQSIDSIEIEDATYRKRYNYETRTIVEGIGDITLNNSGFLRSDAKNILNCVILPNKVIYLNSDYSDHDCYELEQEVSINELEENNQLIYPNPFKNTLNFTKKLSKSKVVVYSISEQIVFENNNFSGNSLDLHFLEKGIYYLKVATEKNYYQKIVKL